MLSAVAGSASVFHYRTPSLPPAAIADRCELGTTHASGFREQPVVRWFRIDSARLPWCWSLRACILPEWPADAFVQKPILDDKFNSFAFC
jgi:hypothetical protein